MWLFGNLRFDPVRRVIYSPKGPVHLPPREADLLTVLIEARGEVLSKDVLLHRVWNDCEVEEGNLTQQISLLRRALASTGDPTAFIETIPRVGYRFAVPARPDQQLPLPPNRPRIPIALAILTLGALLLLVLFLYHRPA